MQLHISVGILVLSIFLILFGLSALLPVPGVLTAIVAFLAGILLLVGK